MVRLGRVHEFVRGLPHGAFHGWYLWIALWLTMDGVMACSMAGIRWYTMVIIMDGAMTCSIIGIRRLRND